MASGWAGALEQDGMGRRGWKQVGQQKGVGRYGGVHCEENNLNTWLKAVFIYTRPDSTLRTRIGLTRLAMAGHARLRGRQDRTVSSVTDIHDQDFLGGAEGIALPSISCKLLLVLVTVVVPPVRPKNSLERPSRMTLVQLP